MLPEVFDLRFRWGVDFPPPWFLLMIRNPNIEQEIAFDQYGTLHLGSRSGSSATVASPGDWVILRLNIETWELLVEHKK